MGKNQLSSRLVRPTSCRNSSNLNIVPASEFAIACFKEPWMTVRNTVAAVGVFAVLAACSPANNAEPAQSAPSRPLAAAAAQTVAAPTTVATIQLPDFTRLVETHGVAVVNISSSQHQKKLRRGHRGGPGLPNIPGLPDDEALQEFFRRFIPPEQQDLPEGHPAPQSLGSGFIVSTDGIILTNAHVVDDAEEVTVRLTDRREFKAKLLGADKKTDIAVLKIDARGLPTVPVGNPETLKVGEWVLAIGSPFGFDNTVTAGIVSAKGRSLPDDSYVPFIQTDVAVNPGNSGGPLFNLRGEVIGINSQIYSRSGGYMGISFAIPIDVAMKVADQLKNNGKFARGRLGVTIQEVNSELARSFGLDRPQGALVTSVEPGSPAEKAGLQTGDVVLAFDGKAIGSSRDLPAMVGQTAPGTKSGLEVWRDQKRLKLAITVGVFDGEKLAGRPGRGKLPDKTDPSDALAGRFGLTLDEVSAEQKKALGISGGALVQKSEGAAAKAGVRRGDVIEKVGSQAVATAAQAVEKLAALKPGQSVPLLIRRDERTLFIALAEVDAKAKKKDKAEQE
jgi:serine protease Do